MINQKKDNVYLNIFFSPALIRMFPLLQNDTDPKFSNL